MNSTERDQLIDALIEGDISEADSVRLEAEFSIDKKARQAYYDRLTLSAKLTTVANAPRNQCEKPFQQLRGVGSQLLPRWRRRSWP